MYTITFMTACGCTKRRKLKSLPPLNIVVALALPPSPLRFNSEIGFDSGTVNIKSRIFNRYKQTGPSAFLYKEVVS